MGAIAQSASSAQPRSGPRSGPLKGRPKSSHPQLKIEGFGPHHGPTKTSRASEATAKIRVHTHTLRSL